MSIASCSPMCMCPRLWHPIEPCAPKNLVAFVGYRSVIKFSEGHGIVISCIAQNHVIQTVSMGQSSSSFRKSKYKSNYRTSNNQISDASKKRHYQPENQIIERHSQTLHPLSPSHHKRSGNTSQGKDDPPIRVCMDGTLARRLQLHKTRNPRRIYCSELLSGHPLGDTIYSIPKPSILPSRLGRMMWGA